jgi:acetoin utilization protein AcuB
MKQMPKIEKVMTFMPHTIGHDIKITTAIDLMREHRIRHLPVLDGGNLVGVLTDRDIKVATSFEGSGDLNVDDVMMPDPYSVRPEAALDEVVQEMAEHKYGCVVVRQENGKIVGIFTAIDAMRSLSELLRQSYKHA